MKTKKILSVFLLSATVLLSAQKYVPFPTENASWNIFYASKWNNYIQTDTTILQYSLKGDTTINNIVYRKVCRNIGSQGTPIYRGVGGLREQDKKIFCFGGNYSSDYTFAFSGEILLYDFNKQIGDTVWYNNQKINYVVTKIDSVKIGKEYRKRYNNRFVEGIGDVIGGLFGAITPIPSCIDCYQEWHFICFSQNGETVYLNPEFIDCNSTLTTGLSETKINEQQVKVYPNLVKDYVTFQFYYADKKYTSIELLDCSGKHLVTVPIGDLPEYKLNLSAYSAGIYLIQVRGINAIEFHKIIKL